MNLPVTTTTDKLVALADYARAIKENHAYVPKWQEFISATELFPANGDTPRNYTLPSTPPPECHGASTEGVSLYLFQIMKGDVLDEYVQANRMGPVIDQDGHYLRFGIGFNRVMYDYIVQHDLYNKNGQDYFDKKTSNPNHSQSPIQWPTHDGDGAGSIFVKSAWKILSSKDDKDSYFRTKAFIYTPATYDKKQNNFDGETDIKAAQCVVQEVGLIGLHIVHRTPSAPQWVWATFEHKSNAPWADQFEKGTSDAPKGAYALFDPKKCPAGLNDCSYNQLPQHPWNPTVNPTKNIPSQLIRMFRPGAQADKLNKEIAAKVPSPWNNYFLVDVQFPTIVGAKQGDGNWAVNPAYPDGVPTPSFLANSTMETYIQGFIASQHTSNGWKIPPEDQMQRQGMTGIAGGVQRVTSSCVSCHYDATTTTGTNSNFVFSLSRGK